MLIKTITHISCVLLNHLENSRESCFKYRIILRFLNVFLIVSEKYKFPLTLLFVHIKH